MATSTPITVTEMPIIPAGGPRDRSADRIVARFADWEDATAVAERWSKNAENTFFQVRFNDGITIATENFMHGRGGDYISTPTARAKKLRIGLAAR